MELPGMTLAKISMAFAMIWAVVYAGEFVSPIVGGMLVPSLGFAQCSDGKPGLSGIGDNFDVHAA